MKELQVSLYDVFGYVAPGIIAFLGMYLIWWRLVIPSHLDWSTVSSAGWAAILLVSYVLGHAIQALANLLVKPLNIGATEDNELDAIKTKSQQLHDSIAIKACRVTNLSDDTKLPPSVLYEIADSYLMQYGKTETRDIYVYREGFYRGLMVSLLVFVLGALCAMTGPDLTVKIFDTTLWCTSGLFGTMAVTAIGISFLSFQRFKRFSTYRVRNALFSFLIVEKSQKKD